MKTIIAGSRTMTPSRFYKAIQKSWMIKDGAITEVVSGTASGSDSFGELWGYLNGIPVVQFYPDWDDIEGVNPIYIKENKRGELYNTRAGFDRNEDMAQYGDALLLIWDGKSGGSKDMRDCAKRRGLIIESIIV